MNEFTTEDLPTLTKLRDTMAGFHREADSMPFETSSAAYLYRIQVAFTRDFCEAVIAKLTPDKGLHN